MVQARAVRRRRTTRARRPDLRQGIDPKAKEAGRRRQEQRRRADTFCTFTGIAFAGIKQLPETLQDRCIVIALYRATGVGNEAPEHLTDGESALLLECRRKIARWADDLGELPKIDRPKELLNRLGDNWFVMRQIATLAGGEWPNRAFAAATEAGDAPEDQNGVAALLEGIWQAFAAKGVVRMKTKDLATRLRPSMAPRFSSTVAPQNSPVWRVLAISPG